MRVFLIAGEASGDRLGGALMAGLRTLQPEIRFDGIGGPLMISHGLQSRFPMDELSVMGIAEVLPKYRHLKRRIAETAAAIAESRPDALITIDSPDFCLRVVKAAQQLGYDGPVIHYVAPSVWAWRPGRAKKMAKLVDHVLALLPFEPPLMEAAGMSCDFVGHPVVAQPRATESQARAFREAHEIEPDAPLVMCLPGSRKGEVSRLAPRFDEALIRVRDRIPELRVVIPTVPGVSRMVRDMTRRWPTAPIVVEAEDDRQAAFMAADLALAASGTVSLELAANGVPMIIAYDMAPLSRWLIGMLLKTDTVTLVNLVSDTRAVPEYLGRNCRADLIANALLELLEMPEKRASQSEAMALTMKRLGEGGAPPGLRAAKSVLDFLQRRG
ncbi:lipid-A-disaccharide synthase [Paracoccus aerodenitrificans]|uniref:lipid-A-disaccharide synthase n=1 Tax=Paracoccus aerodenitrificans TaxID=3017781 RepID=UPI0022F0BA40|nr:lipid-A-disaccharide synthase [Paracoccus aerodenitrificans]WBU65441.1 lipid-A-disaccharide synthase [Paracoccus aerodenitrificans]